MTALVAVVLGMMTYGAACGGSAQSWTNAVPCDTNATHETRNLLARLHWLRGQRLLFGHHETTRFRVNALPPGEPRWSDLRDVTGEWPGLWSFQINFAVKYGDPDGMRREMQYAYCIGAPLSVCWHADNPVTGGGTGDTNIDFATILPGGTNHQKLVDALSGVADFLLTVTNAAGAPIPMLYRAWHEHNLISSFWWNRATPEQFKEFWRFTVSYYRDVRGLHNLLYVFCPNWRAPMASGVIATNYLDAYPGDAWVDVLGLDYYGDLKRAGVTNVLREMVRLGDERGKLATLTESGAHVNGLTDPGAQPDWYSNSLLRVLKDDPLLRTMPYVQTWYNKPGQYWVPFASTNPAYPAFRAFYEDAWTAFGNDLAGLQLYAPVPETAAATLLTAALAATLRKRPQPPGRGQALTYNKSRASARPIR